MIWIVWLFLHSRLHLYFPDIGQSSIFPWRVQKQFYVWASRDQPVENWYSDTASQHVNSFLAHARFARAHNSHQWKQTYTVNAVRALMYYSDMLFHVGFICWALVGNSWLWHSMCAYQNKCVFMYACVFTPTVHTTSPHTSFCFLKSFFFLNSTSHRFIWFQLLSGMIHGTNTTLIQIGLSSVSTAKIADTVNKTVFKSTALTPQSFPRTTDRSVHLRTHGPIIQALCRNTQCLQHPVLHPTWCH